MNNKLSFLEKKSYYKHRQELYELMKSIIVNRYVWIEGEIFKLSSPEQATYIFIWFDRKPFIANYHRKKKQYMIGNQTFNLRSANELKKVIAFVDKDEN